jgi:hypothetical protein
MCEHVHVCMRACAWVHVVPPRLQTLTLTHLSRLDTRHSVGTVFFFVV